MESLALKHTRYGLPQMQQFNPRIVPGHERGRGAVSNRSGRFEKLQYSVFDDGWQTLEDLPKLKTTVSEETAKTIITTNKSPDLWFDKSINTYRGCEHGCVYCYARPSHANLGLSPGLDFESRLFAKTNAARVLRKTLCLRNYKPATIVLGANTDPYQPIEKCYRLTREILEVMIEFSHPVAIVTKSASIVRDIDLLTRLAEKKLVKVAISVTSLDHKLSRALEPRASQPAKRLQALERLANAGIPTAVLMAPIIPAVNDSEIEKVLAAVSVAGASEAGFTALRLPLEVREQFKEWLMVHMPDRAAKVISLVRDMHGGKDYDSRWGHRRRGSGPYAWSLARRFELAAKRVKLNREPVVLRTDLFTRPPQPGEQMDLF